MTNGFKIEVTDIAVVVALDFDVSEEPAAELVSVKSCCIPAVRAGAPVCFGNVFPGMKPPSLTSAVTYLVVADGEIVPLVDAAVSVLDAPFKLRASSLDDQ